MPRTVQLVVGVILFLAGLVFFLQGIDVLKGSGMSDTATWSILGPIIAIVGAALALNGLRGGGTKPR